MNDDTASLFDALSGGAGPAEDFGPLLDAVETEVAVGILRAIASEAQCRIFEIFQDSSDHTDAANRLDAVVASMWNDGWSPITGNLSLFATHFGAVFSVALLDLPGAVAAFRSVNDLRDASVWFPKRQTEFFPFHKALKALTRSESGESFAQMFRDAARSIAD
jgi:hypothetical protein